MVRILRAPSRCLIITGTERWRSPATPVGVRLHIPIGNPGPARAHAVVPAPGRGRKDRRTDPRRIRIQYRRLSPCSSPTCMDSLFPVCFPTHPPVAACGGSHLVTWEVDLPSWVGLVGCGAPFGQPHLPLTGSRPAWGWQGFLPQPSLLPQGPG